MSQFEREIDRAGGVRQCADGDVIHSGGGDLTNVAQTDPAARFEFYLPLPDRDCFAHLRAAHVVEEDHFHAFNFQKRANLIEVIGFDLDAQIGTLGPHALDRRGQPTEARPREKMVVFHQHHVVQPEAMVRAATRDDGRFFKFAQAGSRLAGVEDFARCFFRQRRQIRESRWRCR